MGANFVAGHVGQIRVEAADQRLTHIGMQLGFEQGAVGIRAGENPFLEHTFFQQLLHSLGHVLEVLASLVFDAALGMTSVIAGISIAPALARKRMEQVFALGQFAQAKIEDAGPVPVDQHHAQQRGCAQQVRDRLEMEMAVDEKLRSRQVGGQIVFPPDVLRGTGKHSLAMGSIAAQLARQAQDAVHIGAGAIFLALAFQAAQGFARQVFDQNHVFLVRLVARRGGLEIKTDGTRICILKFSQLSDLFASNSHE